LEPEVKFRLRFTLGLGVVTGEWGEEEWGDGRWEIGDGGRAVGALKDGEEEVVAGVEPAGRRRVRPAGSHASFLPERRSSWT